MVKADPGVFAFYQASTHGEWGVGIDAVSALDCWAFGLPGFQGLKLAPGSAPRMGYTPRGYASTGGSDTFHFPDGNASIARLLVRDLIPAAVPGNDAEDVVDARMPIIRALDRAGNRRARPAQQHRSCARATSAIPKGRGGRGRLPARRRSSIACGPLPACSRART